MDSKEGFKILASSGVDPENIEEMIQKVYLPQLKDMKFLGQASDIESDKVVGGRTLVVYTLKKDGRVFWVDTIINRARAYYRMTLTEKPDMDNKFYDSGMISLLGPGGTPITPEKFKSILEKTFKECEEVYKSKVSLVSKKTLKGSGKRISKMDSESFDSYLDYLSALNLFGKQPHYEVKRDIYKRRIYVFSWNFDNYDYIVELAQDIPYSTQRLEVNHEFDELKDWSWSIPLEKKDTPISIEKFKEEMDLSVSECKEYLAENFNYVASKKKASSDLDKKVCDVLEDLQSRGFVSYEVINDKPGHVQLNAIKETEEEPLVNFITYDISIICKSEQSIQLIMKAEQYSVESKKYNKVANSDFDRLYSIIENFMINAEDKLSIEGDELYNKMLGIYLKVAEEEIPLFAGQNIDSTVYPDGFEVKCDFIRNKNLYHLLISLDGETVKVACASDKDFEDEEYEVIHSFNINKNKYMTGLQFKVAIIDALDKVDKYALSKK